MRIIGQMNTDTDIPCGIHAEFKRCSVMGEHDVIRDPVKKVKTKKSDPPFPFSVLQVDVCSGCTCTQEMMS